ncbi:MAG: hypothetical protein J5859_06440 [Clostridia bacterium]|nr:hypothetical protein [Clostridia bacterium]
MERVVECRTPAKMLAFVRAGTKPGRLPETLWACTKAGNSMLRTRHSFLLDRKTGSRLLLTSSGDTAWVSLLHVGEGGLGAVVERAKETAGRWGVLMLRGPVSPDGSGFGLGLFAGGEDTVSPWHPSNPASWCEEMERCGFEPAETLYEMRMDIPDAESPYRKLAKRGMASGVTVVQADIRDRVCAEAAYAVSGDAHVRSFAAFAGMLKRVKRISEGAGAYIAYRNGAPAGWLLYTVEENGARILHLQVLPGYRHTWVTPALIDKAWELGRARGCLFASTIDAQNRLSLDIARNAGMRICREYRMYRLLL